MSNFLQNHRYTVIALGVLLVIFMMSAYIVPEEEQAVIIRTGEPARPMRAFISAYRSSTAFAASRSGCSIWK